jgi:hypothetical protein
VVTVQEYYDRSAPLRDLLTGTSVKDLSFQVGVLFALELRHLYSIIRSRSGEVVLFSTFRFWLATLAVNAASVGYFHFAVRTQPTMWGWAFLPYYIWLLLGCVVLVVIQQIIVDILNRCGRDPIIKDLTRRELAGNDCNHAVIRRFAPFVFWYLLLVPGLLLISPSPMLVRLAGLGVFFLAASWHLALSQH